MRSRWDPWLAFVFALATGIEGALRPALSHWLLSVSLCLAFACSLAFRTRNPLGATVAAFGLATVVSISELWLGLPEVVLYSSACVLLLPYSLLRWAEPRRVGIGLMFMAAAHVSSVIHRETNGLAEAIGGAVVLLFPAAIGASFRFRAQGQAREVEHARLREREQLARELHDSVAHHVTAITIQAQAARAVLASNPAAATAAIKAIEDESRRTLVELRTIVGALRDDGAEALTPDGTIAGVAGFARETGTPTIAVEIVGDLTGLSASVERAMYRLAQESITNAVKHARNVTRIRIRITAECDAVYLTAEDDGQIPGARRNAGFGLVGMAERAALLGGTFEAGPNANGWRVDAVLPRKASER